MSLRAELAELSAVSRQIGENPLLVQGAGGNTSIKSGDLLWVKASGRWLADAVVEPLFVPVQLSGVRTRVAAGEADPVTKELVEGGPPGLLPSIETTLHALMPHRVVLHVHCIRTLAWAVRHDGQMRIGEHMGGLRWEWVDYRRPGLPLTKQVAEVLAGRQPDVFILANHGLIVGADSVQRAHHVLQEVIARLDQPVRSTPAPDLGRLTSMATGLQFGLPRHAAGHLVALDQAGLRTATAGSLYPDHVVFLGPGLATVESRAALEAMDALEQGPAVVAVPGAGVLTRTGLSRGGQAMLMALGLLAVRIDDSAGIRYLSTDDERELREWDAEKYRIALAGN